MSKRHASAAVDEAFYRMFQYPWGDESVSSLDVATCNEFERELIRIVGMSRAAKIIASSTRSTGKRQKLIHQHAPSGSFVSQKSRLFELKYPSRETIQHLSRPVGGTISTTTTTTPVVSSAPTKIGGQGGTSRLAGTNQPKRGIDSVLAQIAEPTKISTVKKTNDDWESFKESDKQLQDELEKKAQSKDALLVRQDFLLRVDNRKFEIERDERERERAKRGMNG
jgi:hypothetical protein